MQTIKRQTAVLAALVGALALTVPTANAAVPSVSTGGADRVTADSARVHATVNPQGRPTAFYFEYGTTRRYGSRTPDASAGSGGSQRAGTATVGGAWPNNTDP